MTSTEPTHLLSVADKHGAPLADFIHYPADSLLYVRWHGQLTAAEIVRGAKQAGRWRDTLHYTRVLNDKSDSGGDWSEALPWLQYEWLPQALAAGVRAMAYVFSPDRENNFASHEFVAAVRPFIAIELFDDVPAAMAWLRTQ